MAEGGGVVTGERAGRRLAALWATDMGGAVGAPDLAAERASLSFCCGICATTGFNTRGINSPLLFISGKEKQAGNHGATCLCTMQKRQFSRPSYNCDGPMVRTRFTKNR